MKKYFFTIIIFLLSCSPTEPVEIYDDTSVLQDFINNSLGTLDMNLDIDSSGIIEPLELGDQNWDDNGRIISLHCNNIGLSGGIPESIGELTQLEKLVLKSNNLGGEIPLSIGNLQHLTQLSLINDSLIGFIPDTIGNLQKLVRLDIVNNQLTGVIPNSIGDLTTLQYLYLKDNNLSGTIPDEICNIYKIDYTFDLSGNQFCQSLPTCLDTPEKIGYQNCDTSCSIGYENNNGYCYSQTDLRVLDSLIINQDSLNMFFDDNSNGVIEPLELGFQEWSSGRLEKLDCHWVDTANCNLSITIPENIIDLDSLKYLNLQENSLSGQLPDGFGNLTVLKYLNLQYNNLTGSVPETIGDLPELSTLKLQNNKIGCYEFDSVEDTCRVHCNDDIDVCSGYVSENICKIETIEDVDLSNNMLCPCYPKCIENNIGTQETSGCSSCNEGYEQVCYNLPESVTIQEGDSLCFNTDNLAVLQEFIESSLTTSPNSLDMSMDADSSGSIEPLELGIQKWENGKIISFDAKNRGLSGKIPDNIGSLDSLLYLFISDNYLTGELPIGIYTLINLSSLHLSNNQLSGQILPAICIILDNWELDGSHQDSSYLYKNNFCPNEDGYLECIEPYIGEQNTTGCE